MQKTAFPWGDPRYLAPVPALKYTLVFAKTVPFLCAPMEIGTLWTCRDKLCAFNAFY